MAKYNISTIQLSPMLQYINMSQQNRHISVHFSSYAQCMHHWQLLMSSEQKLIIKKNIL